MFDSYYSDFINEISNACDYTFESLILGDDEEWGINNVLSEEELTEQDNESADFRERVIRAATEILEEYLKKYNVTSEYKADVITQAELNSLNGMEQ